MSLYHRLFWINQWSSSPSPLPLSHNAAFFIAFSCLLAEYHTLNFSHQIWGGMKNRDNLIECLHALVWFFLLIFGWNILKCHSTGEHICNYEQFFAFDSVYHAKKRVVYFDDNKIKLESVLRNKFVEINLVYQTTAQSLWVSNGVQVLRMNFVELISWFFHTQLDGKKTWYFVSMPPRFFRSFKQKKDTSSVSKVNLDK